MKRCDICDSTEVHDTLEEIGIIDPIKFWVRNNTGGYDCSRCYTSVKETLEEYKIYDDNTDYSETFPKGYYWIDKDWDKE